MGLGALMAMCMKSTIISDVTPCRPVDSHHRFGGTQCLHLRNLNRLLTAFLAYVSTLTTEAQFSAKHLHIPEDTKRDKKFWEERSVT
jgi:hypothetical protein